MIWLVLLGLVVAWGALVAYFLHDAGLVDMQELARDLDAFYRERRRW